MEKFSNVLQAFKNTLSVFKKADPIRTYEEYCNFLATRAAFISQKTLFGYVKTRMGMKYPLMFDDEVFIESLNIAKWNLYAACLSDLAIFMAAQINKHSGDHELAGKIALKSHQSALQSRFTSEEFNGDIPELATEFENRLALIDWVHASEREGAFKLSPPALVRWAPIDEKLKNFDEELVLNSIRFQWKAIRADFKRLFDIEEFLKEAT